MSIAANIFLKMEETEKLNTKGAGFDDLVTCIRARREALAAKFIEQGVWDAEQGIEQQPALLLRLAIARFGAAAARRFGAILKAVEDPDRQGEIGESTVICNDSDDPLARAAG